MDGPFAEGDEAYDAELFLDEKGEVLECTVFAEDGGEAAAGGLGGCE